MCEMLDSYFLLLSEQVCEQSQNNNTFHANEQINDNENTERDER